MDVRCNRCATEYDFDDALISERGTTVKCTNCGYQFKVFPPQAQSGAPERWMVKTGEGVELVYTSLRELQRGIADRQVGPNDLLSRGQQPARPLGSIAELEPFFNSSAAQASTRPVRTLHGVAPAGRGSGSHSAVQPSAAPAVEPAAVLPPVAPVPVSVATDPFAPTQRVGQSNEPGRSPAAAPRTRPGETPTRPQAQVRSITPAGPNAIRTQPLEQHAQVPMVETVRVETRATPPGGTLIVNDPRPAPEAQRFDAESSARGHGQRTDLDAR